VTVWIWNEREDELLDGVWDGHIILNGVKPMKDEVGYGYLN